MTDWEKLKVVELKEELKRRGIPLTGLKLKQQLIDKLIEVERDAAIDEKAPQDGQESVTGPSRNSSASGTAKLEQNGNAPDDLTTTSDLGQTGKIVQEESRDASTLQPPALVEEDIIVPAEEGAAPDAITFDNEETVREVLEDDPLIPQGKKDEPAGPERGDDMETGFYPRSSKQQPAQDNSHLDTHPPSISPTKEEDPITTTASTRIPTPELLDDQRKRKRRSASLPPDDIEVAQKKARVDNGEHQPTNRQSKALEMIQAATHDAEVSRQPHDDVDEQPLKPMEASEDFNATRVARKAGSLPEVSELQSSRAAVQGTNLKSNNESRALERDIPPARHRATRALYIRNFKRPLHIPSLRSHVSQLARPPAPASESDDADLVELFYLDSIRTHAFILFKTISAASRVRSAMHGTRFPDELMREPLWIDFVPENEVQGWIDIESQQSGRQIGGMRNGGKFEVVYSESPDGGVVARLQNSSGEVSHPSLPPPQTSRPIQATSNSTFSGLHPDRAPLLPRQTTSEVPQRSAKGNAGTGFKALDELFSSTVAKPKLYYKLPAQSIIDRRIDMMRDLRVGHTEMGKSGDEGMKRYTFEDGRGGEEWVDKGPEFGFGRKGQERLAGSRGRGGMRGGRRGGDSWRGR